MKEFIIDENYEQICINPEGSIEISGLWNREAYDVAKDAESAGMTCKVHALTKGVKASVLIDVNHDAIVLTKGKLSIVLFPEQYPVEDIVINIK